MHFYAELLADETLSASDILALIDDHGALRTYALIEAGRHREWGNLTPPLVSPLSVPNRISSLLSGVSFLPQLAYAHCRLNAMDKMPLTLDPNFVKTASKHLKRRRQRLLFLGSKGFGRRSFIEQWAHGEKMPTIEVDWNAISSDETPEHLLQIVGLWFREARLIHAILVFRCDETPSFEIESLLQRIAPKFKQIADHHPGTICLIAQTRWEFFSSLFGPCTEIYCALPSRAQQFRLWQIALTPYVEAPQRDAIANYVALSYRLTMGEISQTIAIARARYAQVPLTGASLAEVLRTTRGQELLGLAELKATPLSMHDIVLSDDTRKILQEILNYARYSERVLDEWGFSKMTQSTGLSVLFSGPPGTGKTLTAGVLAHELKRALYVVDISRVVDKYIGETEKKLAKIFEHAQKSQAILLFDEADSLFAKRTNVKSSNDRYANLEVNYLLQKLEAYPGMTILTTNLADSLDEALARRIQFKIAFPMPNEKERARIWAQLLPEKARCGQIDFERLGRAFEMSGGHIKNAVFRACIEAAAQDMPIETKMLWRAALHEYREMGHVMRDFEEDFEFEEDYDESSDARVF